MFKNLLNINYNLKEEKIIPAHLLLSSNEIECINLKDTI